MDLEYRYETAINYLDNHHDIVKVVHYISTTGHHLKMESTCGIDALAASVCNAIL